MRGTLFAVLLIQCVTTAFGGEWYVGPDGDDTYDGRSKATAWKTLQKGAAALQPGDGLTLLSGEYHQQMIVDAAGRGNAPVVIRAEVPGFSVLKGWVALEWFQKVAGSRFLWSKRVDHPVYRVFESNTKGNLLEAPSLVDMDQFRGSFYYDRAAGMLYVHTRNGQSPNDQSLRATTLPGFGIQVRGSHVTIEGLTLVGFFPKSHDASGQAFGIQLEGDHHTVRNNTLMFNGGGIKVQAEETRINSNWLVGNVDPGYNELAQIYCTSRSKRVTVSNNTVLDGLTHGIRFYGRSEDGVAEGNLIKNARIGLYFKASSGTRIARHNVVVGASYFNFNTGENSGPFTEDHNTLQNLSLWCPNNQAQPGVHTLFFPEEKEPGFCAPEQLDYRLQGDSPHRKKGPEETALGAFPYEGNVFFVDPAGDDKNDGQSVKAAFRTLRHALVSAKPGATIYLTPGRYTECPEITFSGEPDRPIVIRGRGQNLGVTLGSGSGIQIKAASHLQFENLTVVGGIKIQDGKEITLDRCRIEKGGLLIEKCADIWLRRSTVTASTQSAVSIGGECKGIKITSSILEAGSGPSLVSNTEALFSEYNNYLAPEGQPLLRQGEADALTIEAVRKLTSHDRYSISSAPGWVSTGEVRANSPCIGRGELAGPIGAVAPASAALAPGVEEFTVREVTPQTASFTWWTPNTSTVDIRPPGQWPSPLPVYAELHYGTSETCPEVQPSLGDLYHRVSIFDLQPGTTYYYKIVLYKAPAWHSYSAPYLRKNAEKEVAYESEVKELYTPPDGQWQASRRTLYAAPDGQPNHSGQTADAPLSLTAAGDQVKAGDTVILRAGVYHETFAPAATGVPGAPITLRAERLNEAILDGSTYTRPSAVALWFKDRIVIDGLVTRRFADLTYGSRAGMADAHYFLSGCGAIEIRNAVMVGYGHYTKGVTARRGQDLTLRNNVFMDFPTPVSGSIAGRLLLDGNTWYIPAIRSFEVTAGSTTVKNNLFYGQNVMKMGLVPMVAAAAVEESDYNAYFFGTSKRPAFIGYGLPHPKQGEDRMGSIRTQLGLDSHSVEVPASGIAFQGPLPADWIGGKEFQAFKKQVLEATLTPHLKWFDLPATSPLRSAGENGHPIGAYPERELPAPFMQP